MRYTGAIAFFNTRFPYGLRPRAPLSGRFPEAINPGLKPWAAVSSRFAASPRLCCIPSSPKAKAGVDDIRALIDPVLVHDNRDLYLRSGDHLHVDPSMP
jgi:hypothetical protein